MDATARRRGGQPRLAAALRRRGAWTTLAQAWTLHRTTHPKNLILKELTTFRFGVFGTTKEDFLARTDDPAVIAEARAQLALPASERKRHIAGIIHRVAGGQNPYDASAARIALGSNR